MLWWIRMEYRLKHGQHTMPVVTYYIYFFSTDTRPHPLSGSVVLLVASVVVLLKVIDDIFIERYR